MRAGLKVLDSCSSESVEKAKGFLKEGLIRVDIKKTCYEVLCSEVTVYGENGEYSIVTISRSHTNIVYINYNGEVLFDKMSSLSNCTDKECSKEFESVIAEDIYNFALNINLKDIEFIKESATLNNALSQEGLRKDYGLAIGKILQEQIEKGFLNYDLMSQIIIRTSSVSDARMGGATLPAMSNSGSENQGISVTLPVLVTVEFLNSREEEFIRSLALSHMMAIYYSLKIPSSFSSLCCDNSFYGVWSRDSIFIRWGFSNYLNDS